MARRRLVARRLDVAGCDRYLSSGQGLKVWLYPRPARLDGKQPIPRPMRQDPGAAGQVRLHQEIDELMQSL